MTAEIETSPTPSTHPAPVWRVAAGVLVSIVLVFAVRRVITDSGNVSSGTVPDDSPDTAYALHPWLAYLHIGLAIGYLVLAPLQLWAPFRLRHYGVHRRIGRMIVSLVLVATVFAFVFGIRYPVGGVAESIATVVFGGWFGMCLVRAWLAIRAGDIVTHRRWMVRAFSVAIGVGGIRIFVGLFFVFGAGYPAGFAWGFWLGLGLSAVAGEVYVRRHPLPPETATAAP